MKYLVLADSTVEPKAKAGTFVYSLSRTDFGLASADTKRLGYGCQSVTLDPTGDYPSFVMPCSALKAIRPELPVDVKSVHELAETLRKKKTSEILPGGAHNVYVDRDCLKAANVLEELLAKLAVVENGDLQKALRVALSLLIRLEPGDSRTVSDALVALACVSVGDIDDKVRAVLDKYLKGE